jgi:preprotein translocase subunit Sss1
MMGEILRNDGRHEYNGPDRRQHDMPENNNYRRAADYAQLIGKLDNQMNNFSSQIKDLSSTVNTKLDAYQSIVKSELKNLDTKIDAVKEVTENRLNDIEADHMVYRGYVKTQVDHHVTTNEKGHDELKEFVLVNKQDVMGEIQRNTENDEKQQRQIDSHETRLKVLEEKPDKTKAEMFNKIVKWGIGLIAAAGGGYIIKLLTDLLNKI